MQEERKHNTSLRGELSTLEGVLEKSGDQTREELRALKLMFEQSEQSRNTRQCISFIVVVVVLLFVMWWLCCLLVYLFVLK